MRAPSRLTFRWALIGIIILLAVVSFLFLRGPGFWQRRYYPLSHQDAIMAASVRHTVNPYLIAAVINVESHWDADVVSGAGAVGMMQVLPSTAEELARRGRVDRKRFPADKLSDPEVNIEYGTAYLRYLVERYHEVEVALAAYNAGLANADVWASKGGDIRETIQFPETRAFVLKVARGIDRYRSLYPNAFGSGGAR